MYAELLASIDGIGVFPVISLLLFVLVFSVVLIWAARADGARLDACAAIPFDGQTPDAGAQSIRTGGRCDS